MSYQVLARKWRPQNFKQMVGQEHVLKALIHALESQRLHHAYLFTGTRGVGKTTIGRILAKCLSCQQGITAEPCDQCSACTGIAEGRYVDLIEIDAASRTKVEDMRELLDNVPYSPTEGRFKIYLIDEVHMLSSSSFNALLKTLEEPPEHVKFLFATTDPQKLPVTILSRCLQFNLKNMSPERIVAYLQKVLQEEQVDYEEAALWALARAAEGSMRDALSLTDQAIAYGNASLNEVDVSAMLGTVDQKMIYRILDALVRQDGAAVLKEVAALAEFSPDYASVLATLIAILHRIAIEQAVPGAIDNAMGDQALIRQHARQLCAEDVQLFYQIALVSRNDLAITPDPKAGLEMALLRMMAFQLQPPQGETSESLGSPAQERDPVSHAGKVQQSVDAASDDGRDIKPDASASVESGSETRNNEVTVESDNAPAEGPPLDVYDQDPSLAGEGEVSFGPSEVPVSQEGKKKTDLNSADTKYKDEASLESAEVTDEAVCLPEDDKVSSEWAALAARMSVTGMTQNLLLNMVLEKTPDGIDLYVEKGHYRLLTDNHADRIRNALAEHFGDNYSVNFIEGLKSGQETPMMWRERKRIEMQAEAKRTIETDPNVQALIQEFDGVLLEESIQTTRALDNT